MPFLSSVRERITQKIKKALDKGAQIAVVCGGGDIWNTPTVILTTVIALAVAAYVIVQIFRIRPEEIAELLGDPRQTKEKITE